MFYGPPLVFSVALPFSAFCVVAVNPTLSTQTALLAEKLAELFCGRNFIKLSRRFFLGVQKIRHFDGENFTTKASFEDPERARVEL